jgi:hypothetical protein
LTVSTSGLKRFALTSFSRVDGLLPAKFLFFQTTDLSSSLNLSRKTPTGQTIPEIACSNIKEKVRQLKRKCDTSFDRGPTKAKTVRKRLFMSEPVSVSVLENKVEKQESGNKNFAGSKPSTLEKLISQWSEKVDQAGS